MAWGKAGSTTLSSSGDALTTPTLSSNTSLQYLYHGLPTGGELTEYMTLGSGGTKDTGSNYANGVSSNGGAKSNYTSRANIVNAAKSGATTPEFGVGYIFNIAGEEKLIISQHVNASANGSGTAPERSKAVGKHVQTSAVDDIISFDNTGSGDFASGSNLTALGADITPASAVPALGANIQVGSRYEETDTRKMYNLQNPITFEDDFSGADNWTDSGSTPSVNTSTDVIDFEAATANNIKAQTTYDLTSTSDTKWVLRCKLNVTTFTQPTTEYHRFFIGLSSSTSNLNTSEDAIGLKYELGASSLDRLVAIDTNGSTIRATTGDNFTHTSAVETLYVEIIRQSATTYDVNLRSGSHSGTLVEAKTGLGTGSGTSGLRYIKIASYSDHAGNGELSGTVDDIEFYNGVTSTSNIWQEIGT